MSLLVFPPVDHADEHGLIGVGGEMSVENLLEAYKRGIFPWPWSEDYIAWFAPPMRAILDFSSFHVSRSLKKIHKQGQFKLCINTAFEEVISHCRTVKNRKKQKGTWITEELLDGYIDLHKAGYAHSYEVFHGDKLVGGLYGVGIGRYFSGESMFHLEDNASKIALVHCVESLSRKGSTWMDCQVMNPLTAQFGAYEVTREEFMKLLKETLD